MQAIFPQEYFLYCKEKWCGIGEKGPLFGRFDSFQIHPKQKKRRGICAHLLLAFLASFRHRIPHLQYPAKYGMIPLYISLSGQNSSCPAQSPVQPAGAGPAKPASVYINRFLSGKR